MRPDRQPLAKKGAYHPVVLAALIKEKATTELEYATTMGELKVLFPCPATSCNHSKANGINSLRNKHKRPAESPILPATLVLEKNPKVQNTKNNNKNEKTAKNPAKKKKQDQKTVVDPIIPTNNSFASLVLDDAADPQDESPMVEDISETAGNGEDKLDEDVTVPPKIKPIMLKYKDNYNMVLKGLNRMYPNSTNKLTGKYIKIMASTTDEHREITNLLKSKGEEFYAVPALADRPLKVPRCLKCSKEHRTGECPIKERLDTPHCINCDADGHTANWRSCPAFPKIKAKKGAATENRNKVAPKTFTSKKANANLSYANAASNSQQMAAPIEKNEPAKNSNSKSVSNKEEENTSPQGFISAMAEFRKFFQDFPGIIDAGKAFKNAKSSEDRLDIFFGVLASEGKKLNTP
ncbi:hypothetical protein TNCV_2489791 [Trichonephila clavipes]|nr:hypothetical protein TNCV_2489791 [Trichonephila clavipes]